MAYIGRQNLGGAYRQLDDISSGFDGSDTTHTMQVNSQNVTVGDVNQIILSLGGVIQKPGTDFTVSGSVLTFTTAPASGTSFFAILLGSDNGGTVTPTDGSVTGDKIASDLSIATNVTITTADNTDTLTLTSTDADANAGPNLRLYRNSSSPAVSDVIGVIEIEGRNDNSEDIIYQQYQHLIADETDGTEDGYFIFSQMKAGTLTERYRLETGTFVINDPGADFDFRVEGDSQTHLLYVDASTDNVGIGTSSTSEGKLKIVQPAQDLYSLINECSVASGNMYIQRNTFTGQAPDNNTSFAYWLNDTVTARFGVYSDGDVKNHDNSYGSFSDERIKQDIRDSNSQWDDIKAVKVRNYKKKDDVRQYGDKAWEQIGVIAQELEAAGMDKLIKHSNPSEGDIASSSEFGTLNEDGTIKEIKAQVKGVSYTVLYMKALKALQEAMAKIETLEADVKTLKGE